MNKEQQVINENNATNPNKPLTVFELEDMIKELAVAYDQQNAEIARLKQLLNLHQHGKNGNALFPFDE